jgi:hypothetical protein
VDPLVPATAGALVAWAVHAAVDWDWELAAVTSAALLCGCALLVAGRRDEPTWKPSFRARAAVVTALVALGGLTVIALVGNTAVRRASAAADIGDWHRSATEAQKATDWMPWSAEPWRLLGEARLAARQSAPAEAALRNALAKDDRDWLTWFDLAAATSGAERRHALAQARRLNPKSPEIRELFR